MSTSTAIDVSREQLAMIEAPPSDYTWHPIDYDLYLDVVDRKIEEYGLTIVKEQHILYRNTKLYFGKLWVEGSNGVDTGLAQHGVSTMIGLGTSHDKSMACKMAAGSHVSYCENGSWFAEITLSRKNTKYVERDLPALVARALARLWMRREAEIKRIDSYNQMQLNDAKAHDIIIRAFDAKVMPNSKIKAVLHNWRNPEQEVFEPRTMWSLFNAFTEALKGTAEYNLPVRTRALYNLCDKAGTEVGRSLN